MGDLKSLLILLTWTYISFCKIISNTSCENRGSNIFHCRVLPKVLPNGVTDVQSQYTYNEDGSIDSETFKDASWKQVQILKIEDNEFFNKSNAHSIIKVKNNGFGALINLQELHINSLYLRILEKEAFRGLHSLRILNLNRCPHLSFDQLILPALIEAKELQDLQELSLRTIDTYTKDEGFSLNGTLFNATAFARIRGLFLGENTIKYLDLTPLQDKNACDNLRYIDLSNAKIQKINNIFPWKPICQNITFFNLRFASLPERVIRFFDHESIPTMVNVNSPKSLEFFYSVEALDITGIFPDENFGLLKNGTIINLSVPSGWKLKKLHFGRNFLKKVNVTIQCKGILIEELNFTKNDIEFINPKSISCLKFMKLLDFSHNRLGIMEGKYPDLFKKLFLPFHALTYADLRHNYLKHIPPQLLKENKMLEVLDLSYNELKGISFDIGQLQNIKKLNLRRNRILLLEDSFIKSFQSLFETRKNNSVMTNSLILSENPFSCSNCDSLETIKWMVKSKVVDTEKQGIVCTDEGNNIVEVDDKAVANVNNFCERPKRIRAVAISVTVIPLVFMLTFLCIMYIRWKRLGKGTLDENIRLIHHTHDADNDRFFVFFAYSSIDDDFAKQYVCVPLTDTLSDKINIEHLVCDGGRDFKPGHLIIREMYSKVSKSSVVLVLVSRAFCRSAHCRNELQSAHSMNKPIILMFKEHVPENAMTPVMRVLFNRYTRVTWKMENGEPKLSTSWEHLCRSLIELAGNEDGILMHQSFKSYLVSSIASCVRNLSCRTDQ